MATTGVIIPANMQSTRFPGKPLADVGGRPLLSYAVAAARESGIPWCVATSDAAVKAWCNRCFYDCIITSGCRNGTERSAIANRELGWYRIIVFQCDEPDVTGRDLKDLEEFGKDCCTLTCPMKPDDWGNPHSVAVRSYKGTGRLFQRGPTDGEFNRHVGVYLYDAATLKEYLEHPPTPLELSMSLEQLRTMAMGYYWAALKIERPLRSVNVPEDVEQFKEDGKPLSRPA